MDGDNIKLKRKCACLCWNINLNTLDSVDASGKCERRSCGTDSPPLSSFSVMSCDIFEPHFVKNNCNFLPPAMSRYPGRVKQYFIGRAVICSLRQPLNPETDAGIAFVSFSSGPGERLTLQPFAIMKRTSHRMMTDIENASSLFLKVSQKDRPYIYTTA